MRFLRALVAIAVLAALLLGVPWLLLSWGYLEELVTADWSRILTTPDDGRILLGLFTAAGWLAWIVFAATTALEALAVLTRQRISVRLPGTRWLRPGVAALIAAATLTPATAMAAPPLSPQSAAGSTTADLIAGAIRTTDNSTTADASSTTPSRGHEYVVQTGDELWDIAQRELGAGERWREIVDITPGLTAASRLSAGQRIRLPETNHHPRSALPSDDASSRSERVGDEPAEPPREDTTHDNLSPARAETVTVAPGDSLWTLAEAHLGDGERWPEIHHLNEELIAHPDQIDVGWVLTLPLSRPVDSTDEDAQPVTQEPTAGAHQPGLPQVTTEPTTEEVPAPGNATEPAADETPAPQETARALPTRPPTAEHARVQAHAVQTADQEDASVGALLGSMGAVLAAGLATGLTSRRRLQALARTMGRRIAPLGADLSQFWTALVRRSRDTAPEGGNTAPTSWLIGWERSEREVFYDLEAEQCTFVTGNEEDVQGLLGAAITSMLCAPWSEEASLIIADAPDDWAGALDDPAVQNRSTAEALEEFTATIAHRRIGLGGRSLDEVRADPVLASSWAPLVFVFARPLDAQEERSLRRALGLGQVGVCALAASSREDETRIQVESTRLSLPGMASPLLPHLIHAPARRALVELFAATGSSQTDPAPWWVNDEPDAPVRALLPLSHTTAAETIPMPEPPTPEPPSPQLLLLGDVELRNAAGPPPTRATMQCIEYCAWLLQHPGSSSIQMQQGLLIAETTRRSNMSRLRTWLGTAPDGQRYLPDAYSGRIELHPQVSSDWERFDALVSGGVNLARTPLLTEALGLVRGQPLQDVSFQWPWAEDLRTTMEATIVDVACVLFDRCLAQHDLETAQWALSQGRLAAPFDENLASRSVQYWAHLGNRQKADDEVLALTRAARSAGRDLQRETVARIQHALHSMSTAHRRSLAQ